MLRTELIQETRASEWVVVCDQHLGRKEKDTARFTSFLHSIDWTGRGLIMLGDIFDVWLLRKKFLQPEQRQLMHELSELRKRLNVPIIFCAGNRDICATAAGELDAFDHLIIDAGLLELEPGKAVHLSHGDMVNANDVNYKRLRSLLHSKAFFFFTCLLPSSLSAYLLQRAEKLLSGTNLEHKKYFPQDQFLNYLMTAECPNNSKLTLLVGHFHPSETLSFAHQNCSGHVLKPWFSDGAYSILKSSGEIHEMSYDQA